MFVANFEVLCQGICELAGVVSPCVRPHAHGIESMFLVFQGLPITVMHIKRSNSSATALLVAQLGCVRANDELNDWSVLMACNAGVSAAAAPRFGRNPESGDVLLAWP